MQTLNTDIIACGKAQAAGATDFARGCTIARDGAGLYTITLDPVSADILEGMTVVKPLAADRTLQVFAITDTTRRIAAFTAGGAATDTPFSFRISKLRQV